MCVELSASCRGQRPLNLKIIMAETYKSDVLLQAVVKKAKLFTTSETTTKNRKKTLKEVLWTAYAAMAGTDKSKANDEVIKKLESTLVDEGGMVVQSAKNIMSETLRDNDIKRRQTKQDKEDKKAAKQNRPSKKVSNGTKNAGPKEKLEQLAVNLCNGDKDAAKKLAHSVYESLKKQVAADAKASSKATPPKGSKATGTEKIVAVPKGETVESVGKAA